MDLKLKTGSGGRGQGSEKNRCLLTVPRSLIPIPRFESENVAPGLHVLTFARVVGIFQTTNNRMGNLVDGCEQESFDGALLFGRQLSETLALSNQLIACDLL